MSIANFPWRPSSKPTYEGWKQKEGPVATEGQPRSKPTYEGWKRGRKEGAVMAKNMF